MEMHYSWDIYIEYILSLSKVCGIRNIVNPSSFSGVEFAYECMVLWNINPFMPVTPEPPDYIGNIPRTRVIFIKY